MRLSLVAAALVAASPVLSRPASKSIAVSLRKRGLPSGINGVADPNRLSAEMFRIQRKYGRDNGGDMEKRQTGTVPLTDQQGDLLWTGYMTFGGQSFSMDFDTGSSDVWVPSVNCTSCGSQGGYDPAKSQTSKQQSGKFSILYGDGSSVSGPIYSDTVGLGGLTILNQLFSAVTSESGEFESGPSQGICGLGFPNLSDIGSPNIVETAFNQGQIDTPTFIFYLNKILSQLVIGGGNPPQCQSSFACIDIPKSDQGYWKFTGELKGPKLLAAYTGPMIADTGTTLIVGDPVKVSSFCLALGATPCTSIEDCGVLPVASGYYQMPCADVPDLYFTVSGVTFTIPSKNAILGTLTSDKSQCVLAIASSAAAVSVGWIMGDTLLKSVCSKFDLGESQVCFANHQ